MDPITSETESFLPLRISADDDNNSTRTDLENTRHDSSSAAVLGHHQSLTSMPSAPSPPLALMEEDFDLLHHPANAELNDRRERPSSTPETELMGDEDDVDLESRAALTDEPDMGMHSHAMVPYGPGSGILITDDQNRQVFIPDVVNTYQQKKNLAQGMMDLALLSANANQLRYVLETFDRHPYNYVSLVLISISIVFQVAVGIGLIINSQYNVTKEDHIHKADRINNYTVIGIFLITVVNVFITSFGVAEPHPGVKES